MLPKPNREGSGDDAYSTVTSLLSVFWGYNTVLKTLKKFKVSVKTFRLVIKYISYSKGNKMHSENNYLNFTSASVIKQYPGNSVHHFACTSCKKNSHGIVIFIGNQMPFFNRQVRILHAKKESGLKLTRLERPCIQIACFYWTKLYRKWQIRWTDWTLRFRYKLPEEMDEWKFLSIWRKWM